MRKLIVLLIIFFFGCSNEFSMDETVSHENGADKSQQNSSAKKVLSRKIPVDEALANLYAFMENADGGGTRSGFSKSIVDIQPLTRNVITESTRSMDANEEFMLDTALYIVNFGEDEGFAVLSADVEVDDILAVTDMGSLSIEDFEGEDTEGFWDDSVGFSLFNEEENDFYCSSSRLQKYIASLIKSYVANTLSSGDDEIPDVPPTPENDLDCKGDDEPCDSIDTHVHDFKSNYHLSVKEKYGPYLQTAWGQGDPYDRCCPKQNFSNEKRAPGCVSIAVAQIMAYHNYPSDWSWDLIVEKYKEPDDSYEKDSVMNILAYNIKRIGRDCHTIYGKQSFALPINAKRALAKYGYPKTKRIVGYSEGKMLAYLKNGCPVMMAGMTKNLSSAHAWVVDGYLVQEKSEYKKCFCGTSYTTRNKYMSQYMHCNWGWEGKCNGYFNLGIFNTAKVQQYDENDSGETVEDNDNYTFWMRMVVYNNPNN